MKKVCFKCGVEKDLSEFYKHPQMGDGHLNKCKTCNKTDSRQNYYVKAKEDDEFYEKERVRTRLRYRRLNYVDKYKMPSHRDNSIVKGMSKLLQKRGVCMEGKEAHHWNYNLPYSVFVLERKAHSQLHQKLIFDKSRLIFSTNEGDVLDSHEKHLRFISKFTDDYLFIENAKCVNIKQRPRQLMLNI